MNSLSTATMEREAGKIPQITDVHNVQTISLDWTPHTFKQTESDFWTLLIALASNDGEDGTVGLAPTLRRLRELGARLVTTPDVEGPPTSMIRLTAGGMPKRDYQVVRRRHLLPHAREGRRPAKDGGSCCHGSADEGGNRIGRASQRGGTCVTRLSNGVNSRFLLD